MSIFNKLGTLFFISVSMVFSQNTHSKDPLPVSIKNKLQEIYKGANIFEWEVGLINYDNVSDIVVLVSINNVKVNSTEALAVFYGDQKGGYNLEANSLQWTRSDRISWSLLVEKNSVFLSMECAELCGYAASVGGYQFKNIKGKFVLIGENIDVYTNTASSNDGSGYSINYLTRNIISWRAIGKNRREIRRRLDGFSPIGLSEFDRWEKNDPRPKAARGYFNEKLRYIEN